MTDRLSSLEQEALDFIMKMQQAYFECRDLAAVLSGMEPETSWIGSGLGERCSNLEEAKTALASHVQDYPGHFTVTHHHYMTRVLSDTICLVHGELVACPEDPVIADQKNRLSAVCVKTSEGMKLAHLHLSAPCVDQEEGSYYARRDAEERRIGNSHRLEARGRELSILMENIPGGIYQCRNTSEFPLVSVNTGFLNLVGYTREELQERFQDCFIHLILPEDRESVYQATLEQTGANDMLEVEYRIRRKDGQIIWVLDKGRRVVLPDGGDIFYCMLLDITDQRKAREDLRLSLEKHKIIMDQATDIIFEWDIIQNTLVFSSNWSKKFGYDPIRQDISYNILSSNNIHPEDMPVFLKLMEDAANGGSYSEAEFRIRNILGDFIWCRIRATTLYNNAGQAVKAVGVILDIDEEKKLYQRLMEQAQRDSLTNLLNNDTARQAVEAALRAQPGRAGVLLIIDLDDFKGINDRYGHLAGDGVLTDVANALKKLFRGQDVLARIGGDEFLVFMPGAPAIEAQHKAEAIIRSLKDIPIFNRTGMVSCSVGAAACCSSCQSFIDLYRCADMALYQVKNSGKGNFSLYTPELCFQAPDGGVIRTAVNAAIDSDHVSATLGEYCFRLLYNAIDPVTAVTQILEMIGKAYDVSRVYIFESSEDGLYCSNTFEWCNKGVSSEIANLQNLSYARLGDYTANFDKEGLFYCDDIQKLPPVISSFLAEQGVYALLQCAIMDDGQIKGYVGFDECRDNRHWTKEQTNTLTLVANVLSTFLIKLRLKERLAMIKGECNG